VIKQIRVAIFISGKGSNALNLMRYFQNHERIKITLIFSGRSNNLIEKTGHDFGVDFKQADDNRKPWGDLAIKYCKDFKIDLIVLAGFLKKIPESLIENYTNRIINIHPSLLPKFGGKGMYGKHVHEAVIAAGEKKSGITIHFVNEEFDDGEVIAQFEIELTNSETAESLAKKIHLLEMKHFPEVLEGLLF
jgi:phosphoribosylglycinamide formyltransferase-1